MSVLVALPAQRYSSPALAALVASLGVLFLLAGVIAIGLSVMTYFAAKSEIVSGNYFQPDVVGPLAFALLTSAAIVLTKTFTARHRLPSR